MAAETEAGFGAYSFQGKSNMYTHFPYMVLMYYSFKPGIERNLWKNEGFRPTFQISVKTVPILHMHFSVKDVITGFLAL